MPEQDSVTVPRSAATGTGPEKAAELLQLSSPSRRVLFGPLTSFDASSAVVRRLRAAIGLGLLADGVRLPRESDLAAQLGITTFSLRDALGELRNQGLLVTRPGKHGGSFVTYPPDGEELERGELTRLTSTELRDLGDWRLMLAAHTASLAAQRASQSNHNRLATYAEQVGAAENSHQARRAHGRFHVELASAAQSMRLTRAEFGVHEELDWLFGLALGTQERRLASSHGLLEIVDAVRSRDPQRARAAAETYSISLIGELVQLRLQAIASRHQEVAEISEESLAGKLEWLADSLLSLLTSLADDTAPLLSSDVEAQSRRNQVSLAIVQRMGQLPPLVDEIGILAEVGVVPGHRYWTEAWHRTEFGPRKDNSHVMDPDREDFYDYESREFMAKPRELLRPWTAGPYVDYGGADDYIITVSAPIIDTGRFLGIASLDFQVANLERLLAPWLADADGVCLLVNGENRVIVSSTVRYTAGDVITRPQGYGALDIPSLGWTLLTTPGVVADPALDV